MGDFHTPALHCPGCSRLRPHDSARINFNKSDDEADGSSLEAGPPLDLPVGHFRLAAFFVAGKERCDRNGGIRAVASGFAVYQGILAWCFFVGSLAKVQSLIGK